MFRRLVVAACLATGLILAATSVAGASDAIHFTDSWGGSWAHPNRHRHNFCSTHDMRPGESRPAWVDNGYGDTFTGTVYCSHLYKVDPFTTGPWNDGHSVSIPCPAGDRPMRGGAGFTSTPEDALTYVSGGFGHNDDGFWHYKFHNWSHRHAEIEFWAVCLKRQ
jgi:hypothetical protein